jgi:CHAD domain-containing protein
MRSTVERELKLRPGPDFTAPELPGRDLEPAELVASYRDTEDLRLAAAGITLRRRQEPGGAFWQLKLPGEGNRLELEWPATGEQVPDEITSLLIAHTRRRPLRTAATLHTSRSGVTVRRDGTDVAEVVQDIVRVMRDGEEADVFEEIEVELLDGDADDLRSIERLLRDAGAVDGDGRPKAFRALGIPSPPPPQRARSTREALTAALRRQYLEILRTDPITRLGTDAEALHDQRVAVRRLRAMLRAARPLLDRIWADGLRDGLRRAGEVLGSVRDLDVMLTDVERLSAGLPDPERPGATDVLELLRERRSRAMDDLRLELSAPWYISLLNRLELAVDDPHFAGDGSLRRAAGRAHRRARKQVRRLPSDPTDVELHEIRKAVKRARYAAELAGDLGAGGVKRYVRRAKEVQDVLGDHQDAVVERAQLERLDSDLHRPAAHLAVQALCNLEDERRHAARAAFPKAWKRFDRKAASLG